MSNNKMDCWCEACKPQDFNNMRMIVCSICGNKRCPHATNHINECTGSNEPGQKGSSWENYKVPEPREVEIVKIYKNNIWVETDMMGDYHIMMQHEAPGFEPFCFATIHYDYAYTSNSSNSQILYNIMSLLGVDSKDVVIKQREWPKPKWWHTPAYHILSVWWWIKRKFK